MSSVLSIPDVVDSTIKNALKKSAASAATGGAKTSGKMRGVFEYAKSHTFTLIGVIAVALVVAVGAYMAMQHYKKKKKALNTDEEALEENEFVEDGEDEEDDDDEDYAEEAERRPLVKKRPAGTSSGGDDPNWTPLEALIAPDDG